MVSEVSYHSKRYVSLRLFLSLLKYVLRVELGFNHLRDAERIPVLENKYPLVFVVKQITVGSSSAQKLIFGWGTMLKVDLSKYYYEF